MAIFFKLNDKVYKSNNSVTIGRGAPFDDLSDHRDIARAHCKLHYKNKKFHITRLGDKGQVFINGESIPVNKEVAVSTSDSLKIGELVLETIRSYEGKDYAVVKRFYAKTPEIWKIFLILFIITFILVSFTFGAGKVGNNLFITSVLTSIMAAFSSLGKLGNKKQFPKEVFIGKSGLTLHYEERNMSIKFSDIKHLYRKNMIVFIHAHGDVFKINNRLKKNKELFDITLKRVPLSARNTRPQKGVDKERVILFTSLAVVNLIIYLKVDSMAKEDLMFAGSALVAFECIIFFPPLKVVQKKMDISQIVILFCIFSLAGYLNFSSFKEASTQEGYLKKCTSNQIEYCRKIKLSTFLVYSSNRDKTKKEIISEVCSVDMVACEKLKSIN